MNSIDNLREYVLTAPSVCSTTRAILVGYIDGIEREAEDMVPLPLDADGVPIHVGDVMENIVCPSVHREVTGVGVECFYGWDEGNGRYSQFDVACYRHHHAPTVEDVLADVADRAANLTGSYHEGGMNGDEYMDSMRSLVAEYAARLRLAGDGE